MRTFANRKGSTSIRRSRAARAFLYGVFSEVATSKLTHADDNVDRQWKVRRDRGIMVGISSRDRARVGRTWTDKEREILEKRSWKDVRRPIMAAIIACSVAT